MKKRTGRYRSGVSFCVLPGLPLLLLVFTLIAVVSCSSPTDEDGYIPFELFDHELGFVFVATPAEIDPDSNMIELAVRPTISGKGRFLVSGRGDNGAIGQILSPVNQELGQVEFSVVFEEGKRVGVQFELAVLPSLQQVGFGCYAVFDSLLIDGAYYSVFSDESRRIIGWDGSYIISIDRTIKRG